jgi:ribulose-phosphate 3-epimerase
MAKIAPSMMCANIFNLRTILEIFSEEGIDYLHIDIMDGHYVPNLGLSADFCRAVSAYTDIPFDIHLMVENVDRFIPLFSEFAGSIIRFHPERSNHPLRTIEEIRSAGSHPGIVLNPALAVDQVRYLLPEIDTVCVMTVNPGYSGQKLIPGMIEKLGEVYSYCKKMGYVIELEVDGNVSWKNLPRMSRAGADVFVAGTSSIFEKGNLRKNIKRFKSLIGTGE